MSTRPDPVERPEAGGGDSTGSSRRIGRTLEVVLPVYASVVFVILWAYVALAAFTDSTLPADTWAWLSGLESLPAIVAWIAILPLGVFLWAQQAALEPVVMAVVMLGLVGWTALAISGLRRGPGRLRRASRKPLE